MKYFSIFSVLFFVFLSGCTKDDDPAPDPDLESVVSETIGSEGGKLESDDFILTVPPGAFAGNYNLTLNVEPVSEGISDAIITDLFTVEGLPDNIGESLHISIKYSGGLSDMNFIAAGINDTIDLIDTSYVDMVYDLNEATESGGFLSCEIEAASMKKSQLKNGNNDDLKPILKFFGLTKGINKPAGEYFVKKGSLPNDNSKVNELMLVFEDALNRFINAGFEIRGIAEPFIIEFIPNPKNDDETYITRKVKKPGTFIVHYNNPVEITQSTKRTAIGNFFIDILRLSNCNVAKRFRNVIGHWAAAQYGFPTKYYKYGNLYFMDLELDYHYVPGISILFEYLSTLHGDERIARIMNSYCEKQPSMANAVEDVMGDSKEWIYRFHQFLLTSKKFDDLSDSYYAFYCASENTVNSLTDKIAINSKYYADHFNLHHLLLNEQLNENTNLVFSTDDPEATISVIKYKDHDRGLIKDARGILSISKVEDLAEDGYNLFILVTNPESEKEILLTIEKIEKLVPTGCSVSLNQLTASFEEEIPPGTFNNFVDRDLGMSFPKDDPEPEITFSDNTFIQEFSNYPRADGYHYSGRIVIEFEDETLSKISKLHAAWNRARTPGSETDYWKNELWAKEIPLDPTVSYRSYKLSGDDVCENIDSIYQMIDDVTVRYILIDDTWWCGEDSELRIFLSTE